MSLNTDAYRDYLYNQKELRECLELQKDLPNKIEYLKEEIKKFEDSQKINIYKKGI
jgi:hypothetical protein